MGCIYDNSLNLPSGVGCLFQYPLGTLLVLLDLKSFSLPWTKAAPQEVTHYQKKGNE